MNEDQLKKGSTRILILSVLSETPLHGYALARAIENRSGGEGEGAALKMNEGALYPALHALERDGFIVGEWTTPREGAGGAGESPRSVPARRVYSLTDAGRAERERQVAQWRSFRGTMDRVLDSIRPQPAPEPA